MNKPLLLLLGISLAANVALLVGAIGTPAPRSAATGSSVRADGAAGLAGRSADDGADSPVGHATVAAVPTLDAAGLTGIRDRLRAAGMPEEYVRAVVWSRIQRAHRAEREAIVRTAGESSYWKPRDRDVDSAVRTATTELDRAMREEFNLYFDEPRGVVAEARRAREQLAFLPGDKAAEVARISRDYGELTQRVREDMYSGVSLEEDQQKLAILEEERRADLAAVLTPEELELYELHTSSTANTMRRRLGLFEPSEQEFRTIFALQSAFDREYGPNVGAASRESARARAEAQQQLNKGIEAALGPERYAEYMRTTSFDYQAVVKVVDHYGLPRENAVAVHALQTDVQQRRTSAMRGSQEPATRNEAIIALAAETSARVTDLLGEEGAKAYRESAGGWLRNLEEQARRAAASPQP